MSGDFLIYMHTSPSGKSYIGQTCNLTRRNYSHQSDRSCRLFKKAINKYGWENFKHQILLDGLTLDEANIKEEELIAAHGTMSPNGYNLKAGGKSSLHSAETRKRMSESAKKIARLPDLGKKISATKQNMSPERKAEIAEKVRQANLGKKASDETRAKLSAARKGRKRSAESIEKTAAARRGKIVSEETKQRMRASAQLRIAEGRNKAATPGHRMSQDAIDKMRASKINPSEEVRRNISASAKSAWEARKANGTDKQSPETVAKRMAAKKRTLDAKRFAVNKPPPQTGVVIGGD